MKDVHYKDIFENQDTHWWYKAMKEINKSLLRKYLPKKSNLQILDAGCGTGSALKYLATFGDVIGVDLSDEALVYAKKRGKVKKADVASLPFKNESFDLVFCIQVLYHAWVEDEEEVLSEFNRVLKKGGILLIQEPALNWIKGNEDEIAFGKHRFSSKELQSKLERYSFKILKISYINFFLLPIILICRLPEILGVRKRRQVSDIFKLPHIIDSFLFSILRSETFFLNYLNFPLGVDVICVAKK